MFLFFVLNKIKKRFESFLMLKKLFVFCLGLVTLSDFFFRLKKRFVFFLGFS